ncbi:MAG: MEDS domain-containing protein [Candidatus Bathyarchaeota archaeon]|nr:MEDS domain-containing protein [Candidatus Bathyarchaeota archaeon]
MSIELVFTTTVSEEIVQFVGKMKPTDHVLLFYDAAEKKYDILFSFLSAGLASRKGAAYVCSEESPEKIRNSMKAFSIDVRKNEEEGKLAVRTYDGWYIQNGQVDCVRILAGWKETCQEFQKRGLGLRAAGEMACFFKHNKVKELLRYEYALHRVFDIPMEAICAYNVNTIVETGYSEVIMPLVRAHGWAIFTGPGGSMIYEPENVEDYDVENLLRIKI